MSTRRINGWWWVDFRVEGARHRVRSPANSQASAHDYEAILRQRLMRGEALKPGAHATIPLFKTFAAEWFETYVKANNKYSEQKRKRFALDLHLLPLFGRLRLDEISAAEVERFKALKLKEGLAAKSVNNLLCVLMKCLQTAADWGRMASVPKVATLRTVSARLDFLSQGEANALLDAPTAPVWHEMLLVALRTGMRLGELLGLDWRDVDFDRSTIAVRRSIVCGVLGSPKNHRERFIPMAGDLASALARRRQPKGFVFSLRDGVPVTALQAERAIQRATTSAGVRRVSWHVLRHTFASRLVSAGVPLPTVQKFLGHATIAMTLRYVHLAPSMDRKAIEALVCSDGVLEPPWAMGGQWTAGRPGFAATPALASAENSPANKNKNETAHAVSSLNGEHRI